MFASWFVVNVESCNVLFTDRADGLHLLHLHAHHRRERFVLPKTRHRVHKLRKKEGRRYKPILVIEVVLSKTRHRVHKLLPKVFMRCSCGVHAVFMRCSCGVPHEGDGEGRRSVSLAKKITLNIISTEICNNIPALR